MDLSDLWFGYLQLPLNTVTLFISAVAVVFWVRVFGRMKLSERQDEGWLWVFSSVLMALLLNISALILSLGNGEIPVGFDSAILVNARTLELVTDLGRTIMAVSLAVGTFMLYKSMRQKGVVNFMFSPVKIAAEAPAETAAKYRLEPGSSYLVVEGQQRGVLRARAPVQGVDLFADLVKHGIVGFCATRRYPPKLRDDYGLLKTPIVWLTQERGLPESIHPSDITELSHAVKEFIIKGGDTVILIEGVEYLIIHNGFDDVIRLLQGLKDVVAQHKSRLIVTIDPSTINQQQFHLLSRELSEFTYS